MRLLLSCCLLVAGCGFFGASKAPAPAADVELGAAPPSQLLAVKMLSWAESSEGACETDLEGTEAPARFRLAYRSADGGEVVSDTDVDALFADGWKTIARSARGYGFERFGAIEDFDFDITEELRCHCEVPSEDPFHEGVEERHRIDLRLRWQAGETPTATGKLSSGGDVLEVTPVTIGGRIFVYEFYFERPHPRPSAKPCASRFFASFLFDRPVER